MGEYGSGLTFARCCALDKERIKMALQGKIVVGEDEQGFVYGNAPQEECEKFILAAYDNAVYHARESMASGRAMERAIKSEKYRLPFRKYVRFMDEEQQRDYKSTDYIYEDQLEEEKVFEKSNDNTKKKHAQINIQTEKSDEGEMFSYYKNDDGKYCMNLEILCDTKDELIELHEFLSFLMGGLSDEED